MKKIMKLENYSGLLLSALLLSCTVSAAPRSQGVQGVDDTIATDVNVETIVRVLNNDIGRKLRLTTVSGSSVNGGLIRANADRTYLYYTPKTNYVGSDQFSYDFEDSRGRSGSAQVSVTIADADIVVVDDNTSWPVAIADIASTTINTSVNIPVLANDLGQSLQITEANASTQFGGTTSVTGSGITYTPGTDFTGEDSFWYAISDPQGRTNSVKVTVTTIDGGGENSTVGLLNFDLVPTQNNVMYGVNFQYSASGQPETGGFVSFNIHSAVAGATELQFIQGSSPSVLIPNQLVTYIGVDGQYYTSAIDQVRSTSITLKQPVKVAIAQGSNLQNFYADGAHAHVGGLSAMVDFALRELNDSSLNAGKHVLLGDSWFTQGFVEGRLRDRLQNASIISKGIGGNKSSDLLSRFDQDVTAENPDVVWLIAGTNDYYSEVTKDIFVNNMRQMIEKIIAIGARPIVFDSSLAPLMYGSDHLLQLSKSYATGLAEIQLD